MLEKKKNTYVQTLTLSPFLDLLMMEADNTT
jgi:hypothetical protein